MITNIAVELSDEQRNKIAQRIFGSPGKRMITRDELRQVVWGFVTALGDNIVVPTPAEAEDEHRVARRVADEVVSRSPYTAAEQELADRLTAEGRSPEYIRGYISAGRVLARSRGR